MSDSNLRAAPDWVRIVRGEYLEIPDLQLTGPEAQRMWGLGAGPCAAILKALVEEQFLRLTAAGRYVRTGSPGAWGGRRPHEARTA
jgi:hypothetical protein